MKNKYLLPLATLSILLVGCGGSSKKDNTTNPPPVTPPPTVSNLMQQAENDRVANNAAAVSVAIYHQGEVVFADAVGTRLPNGDVPVDHNTLFQIGSTTKVMTSIAALQLIEDGKIALDDKLVDSLSNLSYPEIHGDYWQSIRLDWLMTHQGAFDDAYNGLEHSDDLITYMSQDFTIENGLMNKPGQFFNYSNPNYSFLGAVVAEQSGMDYASYMHQEVFASLGMARSTFDNQQVSEDGNFALGISDLSGTNEPKTDISELIAPEAVLPAGGNTWSTPTEMLQLAQFLMDGNEQVLTEQNVQSITAKHVAMPGPTSLHYGYGMIMSDGFVFNNQWYPIKIYQHGGNANDNAYTSLFYLFPEHDLAVSVLSSGTNDDLTGTLVAALEHVDLLPEPTPFALPTVNTQHFDKFAGEYNVDGISLTIAHQNNNLTLSIPLFDAQNISYSKTLYAYSANSFVLEINDEQLLFTFVSTDNGQTFDYFVNRNAVATRVKEGGTVNMNTTGQSKLLEINTKQFNFN